MKKALALTIIMGMLAGAVGCGPATTSGGILSHPASSMTANFDLYQRASYAPLFALPVFNNLIRFDPEKVAPVIENILPDLAERYEISKSGTELTFWLRQGVTWHNGMPFTADDVVYSVAKMVDPKRSTLASSLSAFERVVKVDDYTVKIYLKAPSPSFVLQLAAPFCVIQAKHLASVDPKSTDFLIGTGPFKFKAYVSGVSMEFVRNPDYFKKGLPKLDGIKIPIIAGQPATLDAFIAGNLDMTSTIMGIRNQEEWDYVKARAPDTVFGTRNISRGTKFYFNTGSTVFKDIRVRQALSILVDNAQMAIATMGSTDWAYLGAGLFYAPYSLPQQQINKLYGWDKPLEERVAIAKALLKEAGVQGFKFNFVVGNIASQTQKAQVLADTYKKYLNVDMVISIKGTAELAVARDTRAFDMLFMDTNSVIGDPDEDMAYFYTKATGNFLGYSNVAADKLWDQESRELDTNKRIALMQEIETLIIKDAVVIPTAGTKQVTSWHPSVKGYVKQDITYGSAGAFEGVWLNK